MTSLDWLTFQSNRRIGACMTFELLYLFAFVLTLVRSIFLIQIILSHWLYFVTYWYIYSLLKCPFAFFLSTLILPWLCICFCRARQVAWSLGGWILRHLRGCFVLILFKEPTFPVGYGSMSLLLLCDMIQSLYLFSSSLWYSQRQLEAVLLARSLVAQRGTTVSEKDSCVLSLRWCHLGQCALVGCIDLCFLDVSGVGSTALQLVFSR